MNSKANASRKLKQPIAVVRRATMATCRDERKPQTSGTLNSRASSINKHTAALTTTKRPATTTQPTQQKSLKRQNSNTENMAPAAKVRKGETVTVANKKGAPKRAAWDYKGRMEDMEEYMTTLKSIQQESIQRIETLESQKDQLQGNVVLKEKEKEEASALSKELQSRLEEKSLVERELREELGREREEKDRVERENEEYKFESELAKNEIKTLKQRLSTMTTEILTVNTELEATKVSFKKANDEIERQSVLISELQNTVKSREETIEELECKLREEETTRRKLHNAVQELKGNIRVFCRVRPSLPTEADVPLTKMEFENDTNVVLCQTNGSESISGTKRQASNLPFNFDKVFPPVSSQETVFSEISQLVQSVLDGYNVCIFAYGQTGSGKTFTMEGDLSERETWGMIPRAMEQVFYTCENLESKGWKYDMKASFLEIYNETIRDLLATGDPNVKHEIKQVVTNTGKQANDVDVTNLKTVTVKSPNQVSSLLHKAYENRAVAATNCNERSSRSHSVFRLKLTGNNDITGEQCQGTLSLVDLAGSERLSQSGSTGARLKETQNINKSLSNLGIVFNALANKDSHVPYRNSKLTYLLQNSIGGNSKSLMFVNISPREDSLQETLSSLRFATKVNTCNIGTAQKVKRN
ncbi:carboxy-terminal kinesin 2-like [Dendronephthya gigantea]|uniref:carboxy-terminal kinesin 2-like n=1 Tax=Dendronephthya gigantea TaxID=151771 RepID=UPI00106C15FF|nr:carboxy-terminal kinesin 2-like [Dendronephthya gigantea]